MKRLTIHYGGRELVNLDVAEFEWKDTDSVIVVTARRKPKPSLADTIGQLTPKKAAPKPLPVTATNGETDG